ncbi:hypothetical protein RB195_017345 [Necator americanus]|uniref:EamA domain-containing protein n=1 Tax=Necator americanus TaxID=51031 RepID=A0ABR1C6Y2_NECAM
MAVAPVCELYQRELDEAVATLRRRGLISDQNSRSTRSRIRSSRRQAEERSQSFIETMQETSHIRTPHKAVIEVLTWGAVLTFLSHIGSSFGSHVASPFLQTIFDKSGAAIFAYIILPILTKMTIRRHKRRGIDDSTIRFMLLMSSLMQGVVSGYVIDSTYLSGEPLAFVTPLAIALAYAGEVKSVYTSRLSLLTACMATSLFANLAIGQLMDAVTKTYEIMAIIYSAAGMATMQLVFKNVKKSGTGHYEQFFLLQSFTYIRGLAFLICGYYRADLTYTRPW